MIMMKKNVMKINLFVLLTFLMTVLPTVLYSQNTSKYFEISKSNRPEMDQMTKSLDSIQDTIDRIQSDSRLGFQIQKDKEEYQSDREIIETINSLFSRHFRSDYRNLALYKSILDEIKTRNDTGKDEISQLQDKFKKYKAELEAIPNKAVIKQMMTMETNRPAQNKDGKKPAPEGKSMLGELNDDWEKAYKNVTSTQDSLMRWSGTVSFNTMHANDLLKTADSLMRENNRRIVSQGQMATPKMNKKMDPAKMRAEFQNQTANSKKILKYYIDKHASSVLWFPLLIAVFIGIWILNNYRKVKTKYAEYWTHENFPYLFPGLWVASFLIVFSFVHLIDINAPWLYLLLVQIATYAMAIWILWKSDQRKISIWLICMIGLLMITTFYSNTRPSDYQLYIIIALNIAEMFFIYKIFKERKSLLQLPKLIVFILGLCFLLSILSIYLAIKDKSTMSFIVTNATLIGVLQIITLSVMKQLITGSLILEIVSSRIGVGIHKSFDSSLVNKSLHIPLLAITVYLWLVMFSANMNIYENFSEQITKIINAPIKLGGAVFTISGILLFTIIIWAVTLLQKYIGYFFGDIGADDDDDDFKSQRSKLTITKLIVICVGYLIAIVASGLPLDKITIVLSALSVGVGMGLQNIVNNFVSGIILIFDRPLQLGDLVEVKGQSGKVQEIGIRASTLITEEGAEIIIPNGDILSNSITNWTLSNNLKRVTTTFKIKTEREREEVRDLILKYMKSTDLVSNDKEIMTYIDILQENVYQIKIQYWTTQVNRIEWVQSEVQFGLYEMFRKNSILVVQ